MEIEKYYFGKIFNDLAIIGSEAKPRNFKVKEIENYSYEFPPYVRFCSFERRKLHVAYTKEEFKWYLKGDRFDNSICKHAPIWLETVNSDGSFNSNYGQYIFGKVNQFEKILNTLINDKDSRRATIMILNQEHILSDDNDLPCTLSISFRIRHDFLNMTVRMRSQDAILGMGNDVVNFSFMHELLFNLLKEHYPNIKYGTYFHSADSFHIYEKHFKMLEDITGIPIIRNVNEIKVNKNFLDIVCPEINGPDEAKFLLKHDFANIPVEFKFSRWLCNKENK